MKLSPLNETTACSVYNQYLDTNINKLIDNLCKNYDNNLTLFHKTFNEIVDLTIATGDVLDNKGKLLGFNRYITFNDPLNVVLPDSEGISGYRKLMDDYKECRLSDDAYRIVLMILSQTKNTVASVETLTQAMSTVTNSEIFVDDSMNMEYITYYFLDRIPGWLEVVIENFDILPRPAGMSTKYISSISRFFGFLIQYPARDPVATAKIFSAFWKARFPIITVDHKQTASLWTQHIQRVPYILQNISQDQYTNILNNINTKMKNEATERDRIWGFTERADQYAASSDISYMYNYNYKQDWQRITYEYTIGARSPEFERGRMWIGQKRAIQSYMDNYKQLYNIGYPLLQEELTYDPRKYLYYDRKSGWYFFKPPDSSGNFNPHFISNVYQDDCGVWFVQDDLSSIFRKGSLLLRQDDYANTKVELKLTTHPLYDAYKYKYNNLSGENQRMLPQILTNFRSAVEIWFYLKKLNQYSFRAVIDFEYRLVGIWELMNGYGAKVGEANREDSHYERGWYYRTLYDIYKDYVGEATSYADRFSDKESPVYKHRQALRYLRNRVRQEREELDRLYNENYAIYTSYSIGVDSSLYSMIKDFKNDATQEYFTDMEKSKGYGYNNEGYSAINLSNKDVKYYYDDARKEQQRYKNRYDNNEKARSECWKLNTKSCQQKVMSGYSLVWCIAEEPLDFDTSTFTPPDNLTNGSTTEDESENWWFNKVKGDKYRLCASDIPSTWANKHVKWRDAAGGKFDEFKKKGDGLQKELDIRNRATENKSLRAIIKDYESYDVPWDLDPINLIVYKILQNSALTYTIY